MYCPSCGVNNDRGESQCYICGSRLPVIAAAAEPPSGRGPRRKVAAVTDRPATAGDRALALLFDRAVIVAAAVLATAWVTSSFGALDSGSPWAVATGVGSFFLTMLLYHVVLEGLFGTTLGKAMMALQIRDVGGRGAFVAALLRNVLRIVDSLGFYLVGFLATMFTRRGQRIGDLVAGTVVMESRRSAPFRAGMMLLWVLIVGSALFSAAAVCPDCRADMRPLQRVTVADR